MENAAAGSLVLSIVSLFLCTLLSPFAWFHAQQKEKQCRQLRVSVPGTLQAGKILGIIGTVLLSVAVFIKLLMFILLLSFRIS